ncbi:MAG: response regulator [Desulfobacteraceae bacterium]|nr:response regulator [Desulfobacteraceae bacterium]
MPAVFSKKPAFMSLIVIFLLAASLIQAEERHLDTAIADQTPVQRGFFSSPSNQFTPFNNPNDYFIMDIERELQQQMAEKQKAVKQISYLKLYLIIFAAILILLMAGIFFLSHRYRNSNKQFAETSEELEKEIGKSEKIQDSLLQSEKSYRLVMDNTIDLILIVQDGYLRFVNPSVERTLEFSRSELSVMQIVDIIHNSDKSFVFKRLTTLPNRPGTTITQSVKVLTKKNELLQMDLHATSITWENRPAALCFLRDTTKTKQLESKVIQSQKLQAIGTLAGGIAHDFNNILAAIMGYTEISIHQARKGSRMEQRLNHVLQACDRAKDLVHQILTFSRQHVQEKRPLRMAPIVKETLHLLRASLPSTIIFHYKIEKDKGVVLADPTNIHQVIMNLCTNAYHAMKDKGGNLNINVKTVNIKNDPENRLLELETGDYVQLTVSDTGHGMSKATIERIFDPYFTTKKQGEGTGLGLSVAHGIVKEMGGAIKVYSEAGIGATFHVYFPIIRAQEQEKLQIHEKLPTGSGTILLIDDEQMIIEIIQEMLESLGYTVVTRVSAIEALHSFTNDPDKYDLILTDLTMPQMTGIELSENVKKIRPDIPIILCSGFSTKISEEKASILGIIAVMNKPILKYDLAHTVYDTFQQSNSN